MGSHPRREGPGGRLLFMLAMCLYTKGYYALGKEVGEGQEEGKVEPPWLLLGGCRAPVYATSKLEV